MTQHSGQVDFNKPECQLPGADSQLHSCQNMLILGANHTSRFAIPALPDIFPGMGLHLCPKSQPGFPDSYPEDNGTNCH
jgi:hypothetical protein